MMNYMKPAYLSAIILSLTAVQLQCPGQEIDESAIVMEMSGKMRPVLPRPDTVSMVFLGDIMLHARQISSAAEKFSAKPGNKAVSVHEAFDFSQFFSEIRRYISDSDLAVANMEFTLGGTPFTGYPAFSAPDSYAEYLADCGIDIFLTANNHIMDRGSKGAARTLEKYAGLEGQYGIRTTGTYATPEQYCKGNPLVMNVSGIKAAFINFTYGTNLAGKDEYPKVNMSEKSRLKHLIQKAEDAGADVIIALPHWGKEYSLRHSESQYELAEWLACNGTDIIIGTHPHVVQDSTTIKTCGGKKVPVFFSLGNAISNMSAPNTQVGLMARIDMVKLMNGTVRILPARLTYLWCSLPGRLKDTHCTIPVKEYLSRAGSWKMPYEYEKMVGTYIRIKAETGIED